MLEQITEGLQDSYEIVMANTSGLTCWCLLWLLVLIPSAQVDA